MEREYVMERDLKEWYEDLINRIMLSKMVSKQEAIEILNDFADKMEQENIKKR